MKLTDRVAVVTGAGTGIGRAIAELFAQQGAKVVVNYSRSRDAAEEVVTRIRSGGGTAVSIAADVSKQSEATALMEAADREFGRIDYLINNAGWSTRVPHQKMDDLTDEIWDRTFNTNLRGVFYCIRSFAPLCPRRRADAEETAGRCDREYRIGCSADGNGEFHGVCGLKGRHGNDDEIARKSARAGDSRERGAAGVRADALCRMAGFGVQRRGEDHAAAPIGNGGRCGRRGPVLRNHGVGNHRRNFNCRWRHGPAGAQLIQLILFHDVRHFRRAHAVHFLDLPADFGGDALGFLFLIEIELHLEIQVGPRHVPMIR